MSESPRTRVLIVGGSVGALETALALHDLASDLVEVELLAPDHDFVYRPMAVAEPFQSGSLKRFDLAGLAQAAGARHRFGTLAAVYPSKKLVRTVERELLPYDALVLALGAQAEAAVPGAITFTGRETVPAMQGLVQDLLDDAIAEVAFAVPSSIGWQLPLYELALLTAAYLDEQGFTARFTIVTPETAPLASFGETASRAVAERLAEREIATRLETYPQEFDGTALRVIPGDPVPAERAVAIPRLRGPGVAGVPHDPNGFIPVDAHGRVLGLEDVYAAGDVTTFPIKQGGLATQQADAVAEQVAAAAGAKIDPKPFEPVLRGLLLTGGAPEFLRAEIARRGQRNSSAATESLWWPPDKIAGRYLAPFLAERSDYAYTY